MRLGVLDIGSNAAQLQVVDALAGAPPLPIRAVKIPTRLGQEASVEGAIGQQGIDRIGMPYPILPYHYRSEREG
ncbi:hypothetical protein [Mycobacterium aquaticum]|uniref:hypothetical protein n=1 Tax=Mycobacterium aquaticum TaxID=1927124 RepID=UPI001301FE62|nr:hypothetical protein [Mycobacterium aquaticum]